MTTVLRPYINYEYIQKVDDGCLEYKSIPMAVVNNLIKIQHFKNDFTGIKQVYNMIPPRPKDLNTMATSIARINNLSYSDAVPRINKNFIQEEVSAVRGFVGNGTQTVVSSPPTPPYVPETPVMSSSGVRLVPSAGFDYGMRQTYNILDQVSSILGIFDESSGVVPLNVNNQEQDEWQSRRNLMTPSPSPIDVGVGEGSFRKGRPPGSGKKQIATEVIDEILQNVIEQTNDGRPDRFQGTFEGTPGRHRNRSSRADRLVGSTERGRGMTAGRSTNPANRSLSRQRSGEGDDPLTPLNLDLSYGASMMGEML